MGRFINGDALASTGQCVLGNNMFAYCNNCPINYSDPSGKLPAAVAKGLIKGLIAGITNMIGAWATGSDGTEIMGAFAEGFGRGFISGFLSFTKYAKHIYAVGTVIWDVGKAVCDAWQSGANTEECIIVGSTQLYAALALVKAPDSIALDLTLQLGTSMVATAFSEGINTKYSGQNQSVTYGPIILEWTDGRRSGGGAASAGACYSALGY